jgi:Na+/melibiose symporter-like transporter
MEQTMTERKASIGMRFFATTLDLFTAFFGFGLAIAYATGMTTQGGFQLTGIPALFLIALVVAYFFVGRRVAGGTLWDRIFRIARPQPQA